MKLRIFLKIRQFFEVLRVLRGSVQLAQNGTLFSISLLGAGGLCTKLYFIVFYFQIFTSMVTHTVYENELTNPSVIKKVQIGA